MQCIVGGHAACALVNSQGCQLYTYAVLFCVLLYVFLLLYCSRLLLQKEGNYVFRSVCLFSLFVCLPVLCITQKRTDFDVRVCVFKVKQILLLWWKIYWYLILPNILYNMLIILYMTCKAVVSYAILGSRFADSFAEREIRHAFIRKVLYWTMNICTGVVVVVDCGFNFIISAKWTKWMTGILFSFDVCLSVSVSVCVSVHSGPVNQTSLKRLKLRTSNLTCMFPGTLRTWPFIFFEKGAWPGLRDPLNFRALNANSSRTVKATDFNFDTRQRCALYEIWHGRTKWGILRETRTRKPRCRWQTRATPAKSLHGLRKSSGVVRCS